MEQEYAHNPKQQHCGFFALVGAPNAGKSTLLNQMVGSKVSIVSPKVQTTRTVMNGICTVGNAQLIFVDTPGIFVPNNEKRLERAIVKAAWGGLGEADHVLLLVDAKKGVCNNTSIIIDKLTETGKKATLVLNKIDLVSHAELLQLTQSLNQTGCFDQTFMVSALKGDGVEDIKKYLASLAPSMPWMYDEDQISTAPLRFLAAEITREALFNRLQKELPYSLSVETEQWEEVKSGVKIHQVIYVLRESQKKIVIGEKGATIKKIGEISRKEIEPLVGTKVHLFLFVKVRENWLDNPSMFTQMGLEFEK